VGERVWVAAPAPAPSPLAGFRAALDSRARRTAADLAAVSRIPAVARTAAVGIGNESIQDISNCRYEEDNHEVGTDQDR
jgi:hypothetical protein